MLVWSRGRGREAGDKVWDSGFPWVGGNTEGLRDWVTAAEEEEENWGTSLYLAQRCAVLWGEGVGVGLDGRKALPLQPTGAEERTKQDLLVLQRKKIDKKLWKL